MTLEYAWSDLAFASKKPLKSLDATFIAASRAISTARFKQLVKSYLPKGNLVIGLSTANFVAAFDGQPQFRTLQLNAIRQIINQVNAASPRQIATLTYAPAEEPFIIAKNLFRRYVFINGSWTQSFHLRPVYYELAKLRADYELLSSFTDEAEARQYLDQIWPEIVAATPLPKPHSALSSAQALELAAAISRRSFDHTFQTGAVLAKPTASNAYQFITAAWNGIVPYQTAAMLAGSTREQHNSPAGDLNYYDTNHAEMSLLVDALASKLDLSGTSLFINLLPCPTCARVLAATPITAIVYQHDHSDGYAFRHFEAAGKTVRRILP